MANNIVLNPQAGDAIALTGVTSAYNQPNAFAQIGVTVYSTASIPANAGNALVGKALTISGFAAAGNNGTFLVLQSTATTITTNNSSGVIVTAAATATFETQGTPATYASKIENLRANQNGDNVTVNANTGDLLVAIVLGLKSYQPFDLLHGESEAPGFLQGLNDFNANPVVTDSSSGGASATVTGVAVAKNVYNLTSIGGAVANITATAVAAGTLTVTAANGFVAGESVAIAGTAEWFLNGTSQTVATASGTSFTVTGFTAPTFVLASVDNAVGADTTYHGTITNGAGNFYAGYTFTVTGFTTSANNVSGVLCTASTATTLTLVNASGAAETHVASAAITAYTNAADTGTASATTSNYIGTGFGSSNSQVGYYFTIAGFANSANNGTFICTANTSTSLTLANVNGVSQTGIATATDYVLTLTTTNSFSVGESVLLANFVNAPFLNSQLVTIVTRTGSVITGNYPTYEENYTGTETAATASLPGGNVWTLAAHLNIADSDPISPVYGSASQWNLDQYYPSIYIYVAENVVAGTYKVNLNSMYQAGIDPPQDYGVGAVPIFDGGVNFQVLSFSGAATTGQPVASSISSGFPAETTSNPATAPASLTISAGDGGALLSIGLMKSNNVMAPGSVGGTPVSLTLSAVAPLNYGTNTQYTPQNYGGANYIGTITGGANNALVGNTFTVTGFTNAVNNGVFVCTASSATQLTLLNGSAIAETHAGAAAYTPLMTRISGGKLVGSEAHYIVEYATVATGTYNPGFSNPLGYAVLVGSIAIAST